MTEETEQGQPEQPPEPWRVLPMQEFVLNISARSRQEETLRIAIDLLATARCRLLIREESEQLTAIENQLIEFRNRHIAATDEMASKFLAGPQTPPPDMLPEELRAVWEAHFGKSGDPSVQARIAAVAKQLLAQPPAGETPGAPPA